MANAFLVFYSIRAASFSASGSASAGVSVADSVGAGVVSAVSICTQDTGTYREDSTRCERPRARARGVFRQPGP